MASALLVGTILTASSAYAVTTVTMDGSKLLNTTGPLSAICGTEPTVPYASDGDPITIHMPPGPNFVIGAVPTGWWRTPPTTDPVWQLAFRSMIWAQTAAYHADYNYLAKSYETIIKQVLAFYAANPDPGTSTWGWDEGTSMRRLTTLNCLYSLKADTRLIPLMQAEVNVHQCPRYYGPPCNAVHNHGLMENMAMYDAGELTGNVAWKDTAVTRMKAEAPQVFDSNGLVKEQSSYYHVVNLRLWETASDKIRSKYPKTSEVIDPEVERAKHAYRWMTRPDGTLAQLGGGTYNYPGLADHAYDATTRTLRDDGYGWLFGRWDFTDPLTTWYAIRYGPGKAYHGTQDRPGVTWSTRGANVLVEPGTFGADPASNYVAYQNAVTSQNVAVPAGLAIKNVPVTLTAATIRSGSHAYSFQDDQWPNRRHTRYVAFYGHGYAPGDQVLIRDTFVDDPSLADNTFRQYFHLDPIWTLQSQTATSAVFKSTTGRTLTMTTTGRVSGIIQGQTYPVVGWHFPTWGSRWWSEEISIRRYGTTGPIDTTFAVS